MVRLWCPQLDARYLILTLGKIRKSLEVIIAPMKLFRLSWLMDCRFLKQKRESNRERRETCCTCWKCSMLPTLVTTTAASVLPHRLSCPFFKTKICIFILDDCKNIANILKAIAERGHVFHQTGSLLSQ